ncbi:hypothetical protein D3C77_610220 [compost metagenome]
MQSLIALQRLQVDGLIQQLAVVEHFQQQFKQIDERDLQLRTAFADSTFKKPGMLAHLQFILRRIVKGIERHLISQALTTEKVIGSYSIKDFIETFVEVVHGHT